MVFQHAVRPILKGSKDIILAIALFTIAGLGLFIGIFGGFRILFVETLPFWFRVLVPFLAPLSFLFGIVVLLHANELSSSSFYDDPAFVKVKRIRTIKFIYRVITSIFLGFSLGFGSKFGFSPIVTLLCIGAGGLFCSSYIIPWWWYFRQRQEILSQEQNEQHLIQP